MRLYFITRNLDTSVGIVTILRTGKPSNRSSIPGEGKGFFSPVKCPDRYWDPPNFLPNERPTRALPQGLIGHGMKLTTHLHLSPRLGTTGATPPLPHTPLWRSQRSLYHYLLYLTTIRQKRISVRAETRHKSSR